MVEHVKYVLLLGSFILILYISKGKLRGAQRKEAPLFCLLTMWKRKKMCWGNPREEGLVTETVYKSTR